MLQEVFGLRRELEQQIHPVSRRENFFFWRFRQIPKSHYQLRHVGLSVRMEQIVSHWQDFHEICYLVIFRKSAKRKFKSHEYRTRMTGSLHEDRYTFLIISRSFLLGMKNVVDKSYRGNQNTHFVFNNFFFFENRAVYR